MGRRQRRGLRNTLSWETLEARQVLSAVPIPVAEFFNVAPLGGLTSASLENTSVITDANESADFTLEVRTGETISAVVTPSDPGAVISVEYIAPNAATATSSSASAPGVTVVLAATSVGGRGLATIRVTSNVRTSFTVDVYRNTVLESQIGESGPSNRLNLGASKVDVDGTVRYAALGNTSLSQSSTTIFNESFETGTNFSTDGLWHVSQSRANDGQPNHAGGALYLGHAERPSLEIGTINWDAELDATANRIWESTPINQTQTQWTFNGTSNPGTNGPASNLAGVSEWYTFGSAATTNSFESSFGDGATEQDATFELVFRPRDFVGTHVLFETGSNTDGTAFLLEDEMLVIRSQNTDNNTRRVVRNFAFDPATDVNKFHHVVVTIHPDSAPAASEVRLFINGVEVGGPVSAKSVLADWSARGDSGLGGANGAFADSNDTTVTGNFDGDIASLRYFNDRLLSVGEVSARYRNLLEGTSFVVGNYNTGERVQGEASTSTINLVGGSDFTLSFDSLIEVEDADEPFELMQVLVRDVATSSEEVLLDRFEGSLPVDTLGSWADIEADLSGFAGRRVQIVFRFDSVDTARNNFEGWWIDNVLVTRSGSPTTDDDQFTVDLSAHVGETVDIVLAGQRGADYSGQTLELRRGSGGALLATGVTDPIRAGSDVTSFDLGILGYEVTTPGLHTVRVVSNVATSDEGYSVLVSPGVAIEAEPNDGGASQRKLGSATGAFRGYLQSEGSQFYSAREAFLADGVQLSFEDFESGVVGADATTTFAAPLSNQTRNVVFPQGIVPGVSISGRGNGALALVGPEFFNVGEPGSKAVGPDAFGEHTNISFTTAVTAVGFDVYNDGNVTVWLYDEADEVIGNSVVSTEPTGTFFGATSSVPIARVELIEAQRSGELIDNLVFGEARVAPTPDPDSFVLSLSAGESVELKTSTPFDSQNGSTPNTLDPRLRVIGPGISLADNDSATDSKNAAIFFTAPSAGDYEVRVEAQSGEGEYVVLISAPEIVGFVNAQRQIVLETNALDVQGLNFFSEDGLLVPIPDDNADPFAFALSNTNRQITLGNLGSSVRLDGQFVTEIRYNGTDPESDLTASYGVGGVEIPFVIEASTAPPIVGFINAQRWIVLEANSLDVQGLNFFSNDGLLVPIPDGDADPFAFALSNTNQQITLGNLGSSVTLNGQFVTSIRYNGTDPESDLTASFGVGGVEIPFAIDTISDEIDPLDCNGDGVTDAADLNCVCEIGAVDQLLAALGLQEADFDGDGSVAFTDFLRLSASFGDSDVGYAFGDIDCSGRVDFADFLILSANFG